MGPQWEPGHQQVQSRPPGQDFSNPRPQLLDWFYGNTRLGQERGGGLVGRPACVQVPFQVEEKHGSYNREEPTPVAIGTRWKLHLTDFLGAPPDPVNVRSGWPPQKVSSAEWPPQKHAG